MYLICTTFPTFSSNMSHATTYVTRTLLANITLSTLMRPRTTLAFALVVFGFGVLGNGASQPIGTPSAKLSWPTESTSWSGSPKQCRDCEIKCRKKGCLSGTCRASSGSGRRLAISVRALCNASAEKGDALIRPAASLSACALGSPISERTT